MHHSESARAFEVGADGPSVAPSFVFTLVG